MGLDRLEGDSLLGLLTLEVRTHSVVFPTANCGEFESHLLALGRV